MSNSNIEEWTVTGGSDYGQLPQPTLTPATHKGDVPVADDCIEMITRLSPQLFLASCIC